MEKSQDKSNDGDDSELNLLVLPLEKNNFGLTKSKFQTLAESLKLGKEELFEKIFLSHFEDCKIYIMKKHGISKDVAYDITMDTLIEFRKLILQDKLAYGNLRFLFTRIASQKFIRSSKQKHRIDLIKFYDIPEYEDKENLYNILNQAWETIDEDTQKILESFFYNKIPLVELAKSMGKSDAFIRKKKQRGLEKIRTIFFKELGIKKQ